MILREEEVKLYTEMFKTHGHSLKIRLYPKKNHSPIFYVIKIDQTKYTTKWEDQKEARRLINVMINYFLMEDRANDRIRNSKTD